MAKKARHMNTQKHESDISPVSLDFSAQIERIKEACGAKTDMDLAKILEIKHSSVASARKRESIPPRWFVEISNRYGVSADWLIFGEAPKYRHKRHAMASSPSFPPSPLDPELLRQVIEVVQDVLERRGMHLEAVKLAHIISLMYDMFHKTQKTPSAIDAERFLSLASLLSSD